jgi:hypothetical protein
MSEKYCNENQKELKKLKKENEKISNKIYDLLNEYMMSDERDDCLELIDKLIENELQQEELCNQ